jgi:hygromycin-B 7''-O-kinase
MSFTERDPGAPRVTPTLPPVGSDAEFELVRRDDALFLPAVEAICTRHGFHGAALERFAVGSVVVHAIGDGHVLKLFPPHVERNFRTELAVLEHLDGRLSVPTPAPVASGELDGWGYVLMRRLQGRSLRDVWPEVPETARLGLCRSLGEAAAGLHALPTDGLEGIEPDWHTFLERQRRGCVERQRRLGVHEAWLEQIPGFLDAAELPGPEPARQVLLHTELMREHVLVQSDAGGWRLSGLLDFEPAMLGAPGYELASVGLFVSEGDRAALGAFLDGYGLPGKERTPELQRRCLAYGLLHRYSHLAWYLERLPVPPGASRLEELAAAWWPLA